MAKLSVLIPLLLAPACTIHPYEPVLNPGPFELATVTAADGAKDVFLLELQTSYGPHLEVRTEYERTRPFLGLQLLELDKSTAQRRGVQPYSGLLVTGLYPKSAAELGGVLAGDVLLSIDGKATVYDNQLAEVESTLKIGAGTEVEVLRGQTPTHLTLTVKPLAEQVRDSQTVPLEATAQQGYLGADLYGIPAVWCERIYGTKRQAVVLANLEVGGPAWVAGFRSGDVVDAVDGGPVPTADELRQRLADRAPQQTPIELQVSRGGRDRHTASLVPRVREGTKEFWFPLVFHLRDGVYQDKWSIGPLGLLVSNRNHYIADGTGRAPTTRNVFSAVLGLFRVETDPDETCVRLLWLIHLHV